MDRDTIVGQWLDCCKRFIERTLQDDAAAWCYP